METMKLGSDEISRLQNLGEGACGTVYKYGNDLAVKILNHKGLEEYNEEDFSKIVGIENETCVFPKCKVEVDGKFQGYVMNYINGCLLWDVVRKLDLETLIIALQKAEADIEKLTKDKIRLVDVNQGGLMWSEESGIQIIDTDFFVRDEYEAEEALDAQNEEQFNSAVLAITHFYSGQPIYQHLLSNREFCDMVTKMNTAIFFAEAFPVDQLICKAVEIFKNEFGVMPSNIAEMEMILKENNIYIQDETQQKSFSEQEIGKATIDEPIVNKDEAEGQLRRNIDSLDGHTGH